MSSSQSSHRVNPSDASEIIFGQKRINASNLDVSDVARHFGMTRESWVDFFSGPQLSGHVPIPLQRQIEVARGTMIYGWYYYPLLTVGSESCFRAVESATKDRAMREGLPSTVRTYKDRIDALAKRGVIPLQEVDRWHAGRNLRNSASHPEDPWIFLPSYASSFLRGSIEQIELLCLDLRPTAAKS